MSLKEFKLITERWSKFLGEQEATPRDNTNPAGDEEAASPENKSRIVYGPIKKDGSGSEMQFMGNLAKGAKALGSSLVPSHTRVIRYAADAITALAYNPKAFSRAHSLSGYKGTFAASTVDVFIATKASKVPTATGGQLTPKPIRYTLVIVKTAQTGKSVQEAELNKFASIAEFVDVNSDYSGEAAEGNFKYHYIILGYNQASDNKPSSIANVGPKALDTPQNAAQQAAEMIFNNTDFIKDDNLSNPFETKIGQIKSLEWLSNQPLPGKDEYMKQGGIPAQPETPAQPEIPAQPETPGQTGELTIDDPNNPGKKIPLPQGSADLTVGTPAPAPGDDNDKIIAKVKSMKGRRGSFSSANERVIIAIADLQRVLAAEMGLDERAQAAFVDGMFGKNTATAIRNAYYGK